MQALFLPEASDYIASSAAESISLAKSVEKSEFVLGLQKEAVSAKLPLSVGIHEPAESGKKLKNAVATIKHNGVVIHDNLELKKETPGGGMKGSAWIWSGVSLTAFMATVIGSTATPLPEPPREPKRRIAEK